MNTINNDNYDKSILSTMTTKSRKMMINIINAECHFNTLKIDLLHKFLHEFPHLTKRLPSISHPPSSCQPHPLHLPQPFLPSRFSFPHPGSQDRQPGGSVPGHLARQHAHPWPCSLHLCYVRVRRRGKVERRGRSIWVSMRRERR